MLGANFVFGFAVFLAAAYVTIVHFWLNQEVQIAQRKGAEEAPLVEATVRASTVKMSATNLHPAMAH